MAASTCTRGASPMQCTTEESQCTTAATYPCAGKVPLRKMRAPDLFDRIVCQCPLLAHRLIMPTPTASSDYAHSYRIVCQCPLLAHRLPMSTPSTSSANAHFYRIVCQCPLLSHRLLMPTSIASSAYAHIPIRVLVAIAKKQFRRTTYCTGVVPVACIAVGQRLCC